VWVARLTILSNTGQIERLETGKGAARGGAMCRNIRVLANYEPPASEAEIRAASLQFVRKITGTNRPAGVNALAFESAVDEIAKISAQLLSSLRTSAAPKNRQVEAAKARLRAAQRYGDN
jgi:hypothetical protein